MIRNFKESDLREIENLYERSNIANSLKTDPDFFRKDKKKFSSETIPNCRNLVYEHEGRIAGVISYTENYIEGLFVLPDFWNKGIGTELLNCASSGKNELYLQVYADNERAIGFYRKNGFEITGSGVCQMTRLPYFEMRKSLK